MSEFRDTSHVTITRQRWDCYFVPGVTSAFAVGAYSAAICGTWRPVYAASLFILVWIYVRFTTPKSGMRVQKICASTGSLQVLILGAAFFALLVLLTLIDTFIFGHRFRDPLQAYHLALYGPAWVLYLTAMYFVDRRYGNSRRKAIG